MNILDIAIAKKLAGGGGGSGTDNYNDLSNLPKINDTTLSGNKSSSALGLQSEINSDSKLASDLVDDTNQDNKFVTSTEKSTWNGKQNAIDADHKINADYVDDSTSTNKFVTASDKETWNAKQNAIDNSHKLSSDLVDDANHTNKFVTSTEKQTWNAKQNAIDADHKLSSSLVSFSTAEAAALASGIDSSKVGQISTNQTNILYAMNHGAKNLFNMYKWMNECSVVGGNKSVDSNYTLTLGATSSNCYTEYKGNTYPSDVEIYVQPNEQYVMTWGYSRAGGSGRGTVYVVFIGSTGETTVSVSAEIKKIEFTTPAGTYGLRVYIKQATSGLYETYAYMMICSKVVWDTFGSGYQPPSVPNYDLTYLEAEDRASLAEVVDSGAKNLIDVNNYSNLDNISISNGVFTTQGDTLTTLRFDVYLRNGGTTLLRVVSAQSISSNGVYYWEFVAPANTNNVLIGHNGGTYNGRATINLTNLVAGQRYVIQVNVTQCQNASGTFKWQDVMICTKAAFGVSPKFVPYRLPYDDVQSKTTLLMNNMGGLTFQGSDLNTLVAGGRYLVNNASDNPVSNAPYNSWQTVEVFQSDYSTYPKVYYQIATDVTGATVTSKWRRRTYSGGGQYNAWTSWSS